MSQIFLELYTSTLTLSWKAYDSHIIISLLSLYHVYSINNVNCYSNHRVHLTNSDTGFVTALNFLNLVLDENFIILN